MKIKITLLEEALGMRPVDQKVFENFIASRHPSGTPQRDELEKPESKEERGTCVWPMTKDNKPMWWDYQVKGMLKEAAKFCRMMDDCHTKEVPAYKTKIDGLIFIYPREIAWVLPEGTATEICQRSMRVDTAQGPRVCVAQSMTIPAGTTCEIEIVNKEKALWPFIKEWLDYGLLHGIGQWRNSGKGVYKYEVISKWDNEDMTYKPYKKKATTPANGDE